MRGTWNDKYSKFDGLCSIKDFKHSDGSVTLGLVSSAKKMGMSAVGLTDHGTFGGAIEFLKECREKNIRPVLGMEGYLSRNHLVHDKTGQPDGRKGNRHLNIFAKNLQGYQNICALSQESSLNGYYYDPRIDFELLNKHKDGIIVTSACLSNVINANLAHDQYDKAKEIVGMFKDIFKDDFYLEMMFHGIDLEGKILPDIQKLSKEMDVKVIISNDVHYINKEDAEFQEYLLCISMDKLIKDPKRKKFPYEEFYFKSQEEMFKIFGHTPEYLTNTIELSEKCDYSELKFIGKGGEMKLPKIALPEGFKSPHDYLEHIAWEGIKKIGLSKSQAHVSRLKRELDDIRLVWDIHQYDFATYFLIVDDIMRFARENDIYSGIRGSGYGSFLLKCLGITEGVDPVEYGLLFERFLGFESRKILLDEDFGITKIEKGS